VEYEYILGEEELVKKHGQLKNMKTGKQSKVTFDKFMDNIQKKYSESKKKRQD
jgi:histidyl-tRNA synthetase